MVYVIHTSFSDLRQERSHLEKDLLGKDPMIPQVLREKRYNSNVSSHHSPAIKYAYQLSRDCVLNL